MSSSDPNLQNIPRPLEEPFPPKIENCKDEEEYLRFLAVYEEEKDEYDFWVRYEIRDAFVPDSQDYALIVFDYINLEAKLQAEYTQDPLLIEMFNEGYDMHGYTAVKSFHLDCTPNECKKKYPQLRQRGKSVRFALQYGGTAFAISRTLKISRGEAQELVDAYYDTFIGEAEYKRKQIQFAHKNGYVTTLAGRKRRLVGINSSNPKMKSYYERIALNCPNQGGAADVIMHAQLDLEHDSQLKKLKCLQIMQTHDEVCILCPLENVEKAMPRIKYLMENCLPEEIKPKSVILDVDGNYSTRSYARAK